MLSTSQQRLVEDNMKLVYLIVSKDYPTYIHDEDIISTGLLGLCKAAEKFDESKGKFSTYAGRCIRNEINQEFIRRKPHASVVSLDGIIGEDTTLGDMIVGEDDVAYLDDNFFDTLSEQERLVLYYNSEGYETDEISDMVGIPVDKVRKTLRLIRLKWKKFNGD